MKNCFLICLVLTVVLLYVCCCNKEVRRRKLRIFVSFSLLWIAWLLAEEEGSEHLALFLSPALFSSPRWRRGKRGRRKKPLLGKNLSLHFFWPENTGWWYRVKILLLLIRKLLFSWRPCWLGTMFYVIPDPGPGLEQCLSNSLADLEGAKNTSTLKSICFSPGSRSLFATNFPLLPPLW